MQKSITEEYIFNEQRTVGGYPISNLVDKINETNKIIGGGNVLDTAYVNHSRFENLVLPVGLVTFSHDSQIGGYQPSKTSKTKSISAGVIDPEVHGYFFDKFVDKRKRNTQKNWPIIKNKSKKSKN